MYLLIVTGLSGAGKSLALRRLEEEGYFCVDNLPSSMLSKFAELCKRAAPPIRKAAVTIDSRESLLTHSAKEITDAIDALDIPHEILFLDARDDVLRKRYNEVRRRHPLGDAGDAETGVKRERQFLQSIRDRANYILDTSDVHPQDYPLLISTIAPALENKEITLFLCSFGYKRGVPIDADVVLDMRFMPNPFYIPALKKLSGLDQAVQEYVLSQPYATEFFTRVEELVRGALPLFQQQDKHILRICFGCTGGRHRSVAVTEEMARRFQGTIPGDVRVYHRDLGLEASDINRRFTDGD